MRRGIGFAALVLYLVGMAVAVGWPDGWEVNRLIVRIHFWVAGLGVPMPFGPDGTAVALNVLACIPPVALAVVLFRRTPWWAWGLAGILLSAAVEITQTLAPVGRNGTVWDVVANGTGALIGGLLGLAWRTRTARDSGAAPTPPPAGR
ncbi:VanZ family protein [Ornithinimicrobium sp. Y1694]|uniref:VanZ family protein n=1 Tax=Ornithinimicrobium sp. Y1694 TaxID=3418590 RepID=UPI003CE713D1